MPERKSLAVAGRSAPLSHGRGSLLRLALVLGFLAFAGPATGRTIVLTDEDCERIAFISADVPKLSWAGYEVETGTFTTSILDFYRNRAFLIRYPIERIPKVARQLQRMKALTEEPPDGGGKVAA